MGHSPFDCAEQLTMCREMLRLSRSMLQQCERECWDELPSLESDRQRYMRELFSSPIDPAIRHEVAETIREILEINERITAACRERQRQITAQLDTLATGHRASQAYEATERHSRDR